MTAFSVATWNINSVRLRIKLVEKYLKAEDPDILCLQETKCPNELFPLKPLEKLGYVHTALHGQKAHHGVAIVSKLEIKKTSLEVFCEKDDCRHVAIQVEPKGMAPIAVHNFYVPSGGDVPDPAENQKFAHKLAFLEEMVPFSKKLKKQEKKGIRQIMVGDLNVAPLENDVWSHKQMLKIVSHTPEEVNRFEKIWAAFGWADIMRQVHPESEKLYTWWSYRARDWAASNRGRRLDHILTSDELAAQLHQLSIHKKARGWEKPSDHVPVLARFNLS